MYSRPKLSTLLINLAEAGKYFTNLHITAMPYSSQSPRKGYCICCHASVLLCIPSQAGSSSSSASCQAEDHSLFTELCLEEAERGSVSSPAALSSQLPRTVLKGFRGNKISHFGGNRLASTSDPKMSEVAQALLDLKYSNTFR